MSVPDVPPESPNDAVVVDGLTYLPIAETGGCDGCVAQSDRAPGQVKCSALPDCVGVIFVRDTPENRAKFIMWRMR